MSPSDARRVEDLFADIADLPTEERRYAVENACAGDEALRKEVISLLEAYEGATAYFENLQQALPILPLSDLLEDERTVDPYGLVGRIISHFRVEEHLGGGGMGIVYRAHDLNLPRDVALKLLPPEMSRNQQAVSRFKQEVIAASSLDHPNIAVVHEVDRLQDGQLFLAMAFYDGETLKKKVARGPLPLKRAATYALGIARGLAEAHKHGIVHRDVKPANVMITKEEHVKLLDFGVAKVSDMSTLTTTGSVVGTLAYMSPEQVRGEKVDARSDVWAMGLVLFEMLTGEHPFLAEHQQAVIHQILNVEPPDVALYRNDIPDELRELVRQCLRKDPEKRVSSAIRMADRLASWLRSQEPAHAVSGRVRYTRQSWIRRAFQRNPVAAATIPIVLATAIVFAVFSALLRSPDHIDVAVLPFVSVGVDPLLVDGLTYTVTSGLVRLEGLKGNFSVVPMADVLSDSVRRAQDAARLYGVEYVVSGSVQPSGEHYAINLDLVDAIQSRIIDTRYIETGSLDVRRIQIEAVAALVDLLDLNIDEDVRRAVEQVETGESGAYDRYTRARGHLLDGDNPSSVDAAIIQLKAAVTEDEDYALAFAALGEAYLQKYRLTSDGSFLEEAIRYGITARDLDENLATVRVALGLTFLEQGQFESAEVELLRANALEPNSPRIKHHLGNVYAQRGKPDLAEQFLRQAIELQPEYWRYYNRLGIFLHDHFRHAEAAVAFQRVVDLRPDYPWGYNNLGAQLQALGRETEALSLYVRATQVDPDYAGAVAFAFNNIARLYYTKRDFASAIGWFEEARGVEELDFDTWDQLGNSYYMVGKQQDADIAWQRTIDLARERLEINPNDRHALNYVAEAEAKRGLFDEALANVNRLLTGEQVVANDLLVAGKVYEMMGRRTHALRFVQQALDAGMSLDDVEVSIWFDDLRESEEYRSLIARQSSAP